MKLGHGLVLLALAAPSLALSQDTGKYQCTLGELVRRVEIYTEPGVTVPCEVHYFKDSEAPGAPEVLWSAQAQAGFCEQKATAFVAKLESWGWNCTASGAPDPAAAPEEPADSAVEDDTDVLSPGDPSGG